MAIESRIYQVPRGQSLGVSLWRCMGEERKLSAQLVTFSCRDAQLVLCSPIEDQETVRLSLRHRPAIDVDLPGTVTCVRRSESGESLVHCAFEHNVSEEALSALVEAGWLEPCESQDQLLPLAGELQWESDSMKAPVVLHNFTAAGFCVVSPRPADEGERLRLVLEKETGQRLLVKATALWHRPTAGERFLLGCAFEGVREYYRLRSFFFRPPPEADEAWQPVPRLTPLSQAATLAILCCNYLHLLVQS